MIGIGRKVHDNLMDLGGVCFYRTTVGLEILVDGNGCGDCGSDKFSGFFDNRLHLHQFQIIASLA